MTLLVIIGGVGVGMMVLALVLGDFLDGLFDGFGIDTGGMVSTEVVGAFLGAFGFGGALLLGSLELTLPLALAGGAVAGVVMAMIALLIVRLLVHMPTDETPRTTDLTGSLARVVTRIPEGGFGEVTVTQAGQPVKLSARAEQAIPEGADVVIVSVISSTAVLVTEAGI